MNNVTDVNCESDGMSETYVSNAKSDMIVARNKKMLFVIPVSVLTSS